MKKQLIFLAAIASLFVACNKESVTRDGEQTTLTVELSGSTHVTRATAGVNETKVNSTQVFVFKQNGNYDGYAAASSSTVKVSCTVGERIVCAVVNAPALDGVASLSDLQAKVSDFAENNAASFVMYGSESKSIAANTSVSVSVSRLVAKVSINGITTDWTADAYKNAEFKITGIYMINVAGDYPYCGVYGINGTAPAHTSTIWYNKRGNQGECQSLLSDSITPVTLPNKGSYTTTHSFYVYPNFTTEDNDSANWCPRKTRLVIETTLNGETMYYPISFKKLEPNRTYTVTALTITRPGSEHPDSPLDIEDVNYTVVVTDWITGETITEKI